MRKNITKKTINAINKRWQAGSNNEQTEALLFLLWDIENNAQSEWGYKYLPNEASLTCTSQNTRPYYNWSMRFENFTIEKNGFEFHFSGTLGLNSVRYANFNKLAEYILNNCNNS